MIRLTKLTDYGIVLMTHLVQHDGRSWVAADLAEETHLPGPTVSKILKLLVRGGLLQSRRGVKGGYLLAKKAAEISVVDVIGALDGPVALTECSDETTEECCYEAVCRVRTHWLQINRVVCEALSSITLEQMAKAVPTEADSRLGMPTGAVTLEQEGLTTLGR